MTPPTLGEAPPVPGLDPALPRPIVRKEGTFLPTPTDRAFAGWMKYMELEYPTQCKGQIDATARIHDEMYKDSWRPWQVGLAVGGTAVVITLIEFFLFSQMR